MVKVKLFFIVTFAAIHSGSAPSSKSPTPDGSGKSTNPFL